VLAQGKFVKVKLAETGIYKLTYEDLVSMGINPANVRVFGYGGGVLDQNFTQTNQTICPKSLFGWKRVVMVFSIPVTISCFTLKA
jgi:hypothetical protein